MLGAVVKKKVSLGLANSGNVGRRWHARQEIPLWVFLWQNCQTFVQVKRATREVDYLPMMTRVPM